MTQWSEWDPKDSKASEKGVLIPRDYFQVYRFEIPPLSAAEMDQGIRYKLRTFYPGNLDDMKVFSRSVKTSSQAYAIVFLMKVEWAETFSRRPVTMVFPFPTQVSNQGPHILVLKKKKKWDVLLYNFGLLEQNLILDEQTYPDFVKKQEVQYGSISQEFVDYENSSERDSWYKKHRQLLSLKEKAKSTGFNPFWIFLLTCIVFLGSLGIFLSQMIPRIQTLSNDVPPVKASVVAVKGMAEIMTHQSQSPLSILTRIYSIRSSDLEIESLTFQGGKLRLEGLTISSLEFFDALRKLPGFSKLVPLQINTINGKKEAFIFEGEVTYEP